MIRFISGRPGEGKSLFMLKLILQELLETDRSIVTNLDLRFSYIHRYLLKHGKPQDPMKRIRVLEDGQLREFYRYRIFDGEEFTLPFKYDRDAEQDVADYEYLMDKEPEMRGTMYALDEVHIPFSSRQWQKIGPAVSHYVSQHRKPDDEMLLNSQYLEQVDKTFRNMATEYYYVADFSKRQKGFLVHSKKFRVDMYYQKATDRDKPANITEFPLDLDEANCYDTAKGVGIRGKGPEKKKRPKGIPIPVFVTGCIAAGLVLLLSIPFLIKTATSKMLGATETMLVDDSTEKESVADVAKGSKSSEVIEGSESGDIEQDYIEYTGMLVMGETVIVNFENSRMLKLPKNEVFTNFEGFIYQGTVFKLKIQERRKQQPVIPEYEYTNA